MKIALGNSRRETRWRNQDVSWEEFCFRLKTTVRTAETVEEYRKLSKGKQDDIKDVGGFVGGHLKEGRRRNGSVLCRSMITLDIDYGSADILDGIEMFFDFRCCLYSTHKHTKEAPRLRMIIPLRREISEEEYPAIARLIANDIGIEFFDDTTYEASRLMYWSSTSSDGEFLYKELEGALLEPDYFLSRYSNWRDSSQWPVSSRQGKVIKRGVSRQVNPLEKEGIIGAFCRTYTIEEAIENFLSEIYEPSLVAGRYDYIPADSTAGVVVYENKFAFSHHGTDPACNKLLNSFDLVRIHKFGDLDEGGDEETVASRLPSFKAMQEFCTKDEQVKNKLVNERMEKAQEEFDTVLEEASGSKLSLVGMIMIWQG